MIYKFIAITIDYNEKSQLPLISSFNVRGRSVQTNSDTCSSTDQEFFNSYLEIDSTRTFVGKQ